MMRSWSDIHVLEISEDYPAVIDALEERLRFSPADTESVIRLGFNLWYAVAEDLRMGRKLPIGRYAGRFMELLNRHRDQLIDNADFCWAYGLGISLFWYDFPDANEELGKSLLDRAADLDAFWARMRAGLARSEEMERFRGRGIFESYYLQ